MNPIQYSESYQYMNPKLHNPIPFSPLHVHLGIPKNRNKLSFIVKCYQYNFRFCLDDINVKSTRKGLVNQILFVNTQDMGMCRTYWMKILKVIMLVFVDCWLVDQFENSLDWIFQQVKILSLNK